VKKYDRELAAIDWGVLPPDRLPGGMGELADGWIANALADHDKYAHLWAWQVSMRLCEFYPDLALALILAVLERGISNEVGELLAAGPLEDLLGFHGPAVIDELERLARENQILRDTLHGVRQFMMSDEIWARVVAARGPGAAP
jgi:hypothetical protein